MIKNVSDLNNWEEGINNIICGDCLEFMKDIPDNSVDCIITDPPYGIDYLSHWTNNHTKLKNDGLKEWQKYLPLWLNEMKRIITENGCCCCCCGGGKTPVTALFTIEAIKHFELIQTLVWRKFIGLGWRYRPSYENIVILSKSKNDYSFYDDSKKCSNVIEGINQDIPDNTEHPTQKPIALMKKLIMIHTKPNDLILDPFCGSGTTCVAAKELGRRFIGCELSEKYCKIGEKRLSQEILL
jgi:site-specific DNA-methyltransferase (adenine-specific)